MRDLITHPCLHSNGMDAQLYHTVVYMDILTYPCPECNAGLSHRISKRGPWSQYIYIYILNIYNYYIYIKAQSMSKRKACTGPSIL